MRRFYINVDVFIACVFQTQGYKLIRSVDNLGFIDVYMKEELDELYNESVGITYYKRRRSMCSILNEVGQ